MICSTQNVPAGCGGGSVDVTALGQSNVFLRCLPAVAAVATGGGLKNAFVIVQITRFEQVIGVFTIQAPTEAIKVAGYSAHILLVSWCELNVLFWLFFNRTVNKTLLRYHKIIFFCG